MPAVLEEAREGSHRKLKERHIIQWENEVLVEVWIGHAIRIINYSRESSIQIPNSSQAPGLK